LAGKGLDYLFEKLKKENAEKYGKEISRYWGNNNGNSLGEIRIHFEDNNNSFTIEGYPENMKRMTEKQRKIIKNALEEKTKTLVVYDSWGRVSVYQDDEYGNKVNINA
jgi:hypothetical protein